MSRRAPNRRRGPGRLLLGAALIALVAVVAPTLRPQNARDFTARVVRIQDGDTLTVLLRGHETRIRLHGIDCPEKGQPFGDRARRRLSELTFGREIRVQVRDRDRYGRLVAEVSAAGLDVNREMVRAGLAWAYRRYSEVYVPEEEEARRERRGLWSDAHPVAPWEYRN